MDADTSDMKAVIDAVQDRTPRIIAEHGLFFLARPEGTDRWHTEDITRAAKARLKEPERRIGTSTHGSLASFLNHLTSENHLDEQEVVAFADPDGPQVVAIYNYWGGWRDYRAIWDCTLSPEFETWKAMDRRYVDQTTFAEFLLENMGDIDTAEGMDAAGMLEAAKDLEINRDVAFASKIDLSTGAARFKYEDTDRNTGAVFLPKEFTIKVKIFVDDAQEIDVRCQLRYRVAEGHLRLGIVMLPPPKVLIRKALELALVVIRDRAGIEVFIGTPES